jgi:hypothetical protein
MDSEAEVKNGDEFAVVLGSCENQDGDVGVLRIRRYAARIGLH